ncbi:MAG: ribbon-helix-helix domain-containing protein [Spirochaetaceae bacterium]|nr:ribbon-helix-helix domain-containing protein [Spirochaetaceae bacterium]
MRTTLTLEDDLAAVLKERAGKLGVSFKEVVNQTIRQGLGQSAAGRGTPPTTKPHHFGFRPGVDLDKLNQLADELEAEAFVARHNRETGLR